MKALRDICESSELKLTESAQKRGVLGVVEGVFFVADRPSRNGRLYPRELWENVLRSEDVNRLLQNRLMIGTVGHDEVDFDSLIRDQKASHVVTELRMLPDGRGYGKAEILDTPVGRILHTLLKSGSRMSVSSKGYGDYSGMTAEGIQEVDPNSYVLERFDFVVDPGFLEARPSLKEQYEKAIKDRSEDTDVVRKLVRIKQDLEERLAKFKKGMGTDEFDAKLEELCDKLVEEFGIHPDDLKGKTYAEILEKINTSLDSIKAKLASSSSLDEKGESKMTDKRDELREKLRERIRERIRQRLAEKREGESERLESKKVDRKALLERIRCRMKIRQLLRERRERMLGRPSISPLRRRPLERLLEKSDGRSVMIRQKDMSLTERKDYGGIKLDPESVEVILGKLERRGVTRDDFQKHEVRTLLRDGQIYVEVSDYSRKTDDDYPDYSDYHSYLGFRHLRRIGALMKRMQSEGFDIEYRNLPRGGKWGVVYILRGIPDWVEELIGTETPPVRESVDAKRMRFLLRKALPVIKEVNRLGGIENIRKSLKESKETLTGIGKKLLEEYASKLSAMTGVDKESAKKLIKKYGFEEAKAQLKARKGISESNVPRKVITDSPVTSSSEDRPLSEVILKRIDEQVKKRPAALPQDIYKP
jgi:hypothetical protein